MGTISLGYNSGFLVDVGAGISVAGFEKDWNFFRPSINTSIGYEYNRIIEKTSMAPN